MNNKFNYNDKYLLIVSSKKDYEKFQYSFKNILLLKNEPKKIKDTTNFLKSNNYQQIIFVDYNNLFLQLINSFEKNYILKIIFTKELGTFSNKINFEMFSKIYELYEEKTINEIGFIDKSLYDAFKNKIKCSLLFLDRKEENKVTIHDETISIINDSKNVYHSFYNSLSAISLTDKTLKIKKIDKETKNFLELFKIKNEKAKNKIEKSILNLYINFSDNDNLEILKSMDQETLCLVGNTSLFDSNTYLKEKLVLKSDDDINEIKSKIEDALKNKEKILNEYAKFRKDYSSISKKSILDFTDEVEKKQKEKYECLISVIVPVYNSEKYLDNTLKSIINARVKSMEVIIINDGSTDKSEEIILKYKNKYPKLINYYKKKNEGIGYVRSLGLRYAKGKYISAVDSDDQINKNFYKGALKYLEKDIDMVIYDIKTYNKEMIYDTPALEPMFNNKSIYEGILYTTIMPSQCNKIIKKSIYEEMKLTYGTGKYEDLDTNAIALLNVKKFKYIKKPYYKYFIRHDCITKSGLKYDMIDAIKLLDERLLKYKKYNTLDINEYKYYLYSWRIEECIINVLYDLEEKKRNAMIDYAMKKIKDTMLEIFESDLYKEMLSKQPEDKQKYIEERNKNIKNDTFKKFISKKIKEEKVLKLTSVEMLYI